MAYERSPAAPASFEPAVRGAPELPGRGARSAARLGRASASPAPPAFASTVPIALTAPAVSAAPATPTVSAAPVGPAAPAGPSVPPPTRSYAAPGAYAPPPAPLATPQGGAPPRRTRRWRRGAPRPLVITVVALVVVLVLGTATVVGLRLLRKNSTAGATTTAVLPSDDWAHGARKAWTLDTSDGAQGSLTAVAGNNDQLVVRNTTNYAPDSGRIEIRVTAYDISGDEPQEQWSTNLDYQTDPALSHYHYYTPFYWGDYIIVDDKLLRTDNGEASDAPWDKFPGIRGDYAIACDEEDHCSAWNSEDPDRKLWETDIPDSFEYTHNGDSGILNGVYEGDKAIAFASPSTAVDLDTGELYDFHIDYSRNKEGVFQSDELFSIRVLADGWSKYNARSDRITILSPTGEELETLDGELPYDASVYLTDSHPRPTAAELKSYIEDGDADWAQIRGEFNKNSNTSCPITLTIGDSTFKPADESGSCIGLFPYPLAGPRLSLSSDGSVLMSSLEALSTSTGRQIGGMWSVEDGEIIDLPGNKFSGDYTAFYLVNPELIVAYEIGGGSNASNELTAYRPDKK